MSKRFWILVSALQAIAICILVVLLLGGEGSTGWGELDEINAQLIDVPDEVDAREASRREPKLAESETPSPLPSAKKSQGPPPRPLRKIGAVVYGVALDENDQPSEDVHASIIVRKGGSPQFKNITIQRDGSFTMAGLTPGLWKLRVSAEGMQPIEHELAIKPEDDFLRLDFLLKASVRVPVRVLNSEGEPFVDALVAQPGKLFINLSAVATIEKPVGELPPTTMNHHRYFGVAEFKSRGSSGAPQRLGLGAIGYLDLGTHDLPVHISLVMRSAVLASKLVSAGEKEVVFTVSLDDVKAKNSFFRGQIVDGRTGEPLSEGRVAHGDRTSNLRSSPVDEAGRFESTPVAPGFARIIISAPGFGTKRELVLMKAGETVELGTIALFPEVAVSGEVLNAKGEGIPANLKWHRPDAEAPGRRSDPWFGAFSKQNGTFELKRMPRGRIFLTAKVRNEAMTWTTLNVGAEGAENLRLQFSSDISTLRLVPTFGARDMRRVEIREAEGNLLQIYEQIGTWVIDEPLPFGRYSVRALIGTRVIMDQTVKLGASMQRVDIP